MVETPVRPVDHVVGQVLQHIAPIPPVLREVVANLFAVPLDHYLQLVHDDDAVVGEADDLRRRIGDE